MELFQKDAVDLGQYVTTKYVNKNLQMSIFDTFEILNGIISSLCVFMLFLKHVFIPTKQIMTIYNGTSQGWSWRYV